MKVKFRHDQGSASIAEDGLIFRPPYFFGVTDGVSGLYLPSEGPKKFYDGLSGGQLASLMVSKAFAEARAFDRLQMVLSAASLLLREEAEIHGLSVLRSELLPSAAFAVSQIGNTFVEIAQGGDSLAVWEMKDGTLGAIPNQMFEYESRQVKTIAQLMKKHQGNRQKMWEEFNPILTRERRANVNKTYFLLNGDRVSELMQHVTLEKEKLKTLILFTDGFVPFEWTEDETDLAFKVFCFYKNGGLENVLSKTRQIAEQEKSSSHEDLPEATAIAIEF